MPNLEDEQKNADASQDFRPTRWVETSKSGAVVSLEALPSAALDMLAAGESDRAFAYADRRCRRQHPSARDLSLRARTHREAGREAAAWRDLEAASQDDPTDLTIDLAALEWGPPPLRREAAGKILERKICAPAFRRAALASLFDEGERLRHGLERGPHGVAGWIAWPGEAAILLRAPGADEPETFRLEPDPVHPLATAGISAADLHFETVAEGAFLEAVFADGRVQRLDPAAPRARGGGARLQSRPAAMGEAEPFVNIVVPVYEDFEATRLCLESLDLARPAFEHRILVIDDASPNEALKAYLDAGAQAKRFELLRNSVNAGFAAAVNAALAQTERGDALLLNADTILAPGVVDRLASLSRSTPRIGTLTPLSNNGELTSYPERHVANPTPSRESTIALDARARAAHGDALVDLPSGVGFCLYVSEACLAAVGGLPEVYAQGYYEDVEFCLAARERGFRNVAAVGVYVAHVGARSFGARKRALVLRNERLIEQRFPGHRLETAAYVECDPLAPFRAALDAASPPQGHTVLLGLGPGAATGLGRRRAAQLKAQSPDLNVLRLEAAANGMARMVAEGGGAPQSMSFSLQDGEGAVSLAAYLAKLDLKRLELADPASLSEPALATLLGIEAETLLLCGDLGWFSTPAAAPDRRCEAPDLASPCETCRKSAAARTDDETRRLRLGRALEQAAGVVPLDRMADAFARRVFKSKARELALLTSEAAVAAVPASPRLRLGVLAPQPSAAVDRLLLRIARRLAAADAPVSLVVFGGCVDDDALMATGKAFVTGPAAPEEFVEMAQHYGVDSLLAPQRGGGFGDADAAARRLGLAKAYFDWSFGALAVENGDLSLDPRICEDKAAALIVAWMNPGRQTAA